jgi:hypothetical protein
MSIDVSDCDAPDAEPSAPCFALVTAFPDPPVRAALLEQDLRQMTTETIKTSLMAVVMGKVIDEFIA